MGALVGGSTLSTTPRGRTTPPAERVTLACVEDARCTAGVPTLLLGDFNCSLSGLPCGAALGRLGWLDPLLGVPTSKAALWPKRIDWIVVNRAARWAGAAVRNL